MNDQLELEIKYEDFEAYHDHMGKQLHVHGVCLIEGGGFAVDLRPADGTSSSPERLTMELSVHPTGESPSRQPLDWHRPWEDDHPYKEVDFVVTGVKAAAPEPLKVKDVY